MGVSEISEILYFSDQIHFDFEKDKKIYVRDIIAHLEGLEIISQKIPVLFEKLLIEKGVKGVNVKFSSLEIEKIASGSYTDWLNLGLEFLFLKEADPETKKKVVEDIKKMKTSTKVALLIGVTAVGILAAKSCSSSDTGSNINGIQQNFAINIGSSFNIKPEKVLPIIQEMGKKATITDEKATIGFLRPAKRAGGNIVLSKSETKDDKLLIPENIIQQTPSEYVAPEKKLHVETCQDVDLQIRALDMDNPEKGWAAIIPDVLPGHRLKLELSQEVDPIKLSALSVKADIEVTYKINSDGSKKPVKVLVLDVK